VPVLAIDLAITAIALYLVARLVVARIRSNSVGRIGVAAPVAALMLSAPSLFKVTGVLDIPWWEVAVLSLLLGAIGYLYFYVRAPAIIARVRGTRATAPHRRDDPPA
jgi:hypothetical protein